MGPKPKGRKKKLAFEVTPAMDHANMYEGEVVERSNRDDNEGLHDGDHGDIGDDIPELHGLQTPNITLCSNKLGLMSSVLSNDRFIPLTRFQINPAFSSLRNSPVMVKKSQVLDESPWQRGTLIVSEMGTGHGEMAPKPETTPKPGSSTIKVNNDDDRAKQPEMGTQKRTNISAEDKAAI